MSERRLELRYRNPAISEGAWEVHKLGATKPPFLVVAKTDDALSVRSIIRAIQDAPELARRLEGSPVLILPPGSEFELWEVGE